MFKSLVIPLVMVFICFMPVPVLAIDAPDFINKGADIQRDLGNKIEVVVDNLSYAVLGISTIGYIVVAGLFVTGRSEQARALAISATVGVILVTLAKSVVGLML